MNVSVLAELEVNGPDRCQSMDEPEARRYCLRVTESSQENFHVLSRFVPVSLRDDFAAIYAFCRWSDDLGDEVGDPARSLELLSWWRRELESCYEDAPRHPIFVGLRATIRNHGLPKKLFDDLISAFEQDQRVTRYETWDELLDYCRLSADPVGRLVLMVLGVERSEEVFAKSDLICTGLQLTNHWQDIQRDVIERDRIYVPRELISIPDFESRLRRSAKQGFAVDRDFLPAARKLVRTCVERTWPMFERGSKLVEMLPHESKPIVWLFAAGGAGVLRQIENWDYETTIHRPTLGKISRAWLLIRAWWMYHWSVKHQESVRKEART